MAFSGAAGPDSRHHHVMLSGDASHIVSITGVARSGSCPLRHGRFWCTAEGGDGMTPREGLDGDAGPEHAGGAVQRDFHVSAFSGQFRRW